MENVRRILFASVEEFIGSICHDIIKQFQFLLQEQQGKIVANVESEEILANLLYLLAQPSRLIDVYKYQLELRENVFNERNYEYNTDFKYKTNQILNDFTTKSSKLYEESKSLPLAEDSIASIQIEDTENELDDYEPSSDILTDLDTEAIFSEIDFEVDLKNRVKPSDSPSTSKEAKNKKEKPFLFRLFKNLKNGRDYKSDHSITDSDVTDDEKSFTYPLENSLEYVTCRICEEKILPSQLESHSVTCGVKNEFYFKLNECVIRLEKLLDAVHSRIAELEKQSCEKDASELFDALNLYSSAIRKANLLNDETNSQTFEDLSRLLKKFQKKCAKLIFNQDVFLSSFYTRITFVIEEKMNCMKNYYEKIEKNKSKSHSRRSSSSSSFSTSQGDSISTNEKRASRLVSLFSAFLKGGRKRVNSTASSSPSNFSKEIMSKKQISIKDFEILKPISKGAYGRVYISRKKTTNDLFAIKVLKKADMIRKNMLTQVLAEKRVMSIVNTNMIVKLYYAFQSQDYLYLVMEYMNGGDLSALLHAFQMLPEHMARFYIAEAALALNYLHENGIVHRDIKPDNMLIGKDGHLKLTDFGLSRMSFQKDITQPQSIHLPSLTNHSPLKPMVNFGNNHSFPLKNLETQTQRKKTSFLGTPDYLSPELILGTGSGDYVDWWALGICLYELLVGIPPFNGDNPEIIFKNIISHAIDWNSSQLTDVSREAKDLLKRLLEPSSEKRMTWLELKAHPFFSAINWDGLRESEPPFIPNPESELDTSYFEPRNTSRFEPNWQSLGPSAADLENQMNHIKLDMQEQPFSLVGSSAARATSSYDAFAFRNVNFLEDINKRSLSVVEKRD